MPRIYLVVVLLVPVFVIYFGGSLISTRNFSPEQAFLFPLAVSIWPGGPLFLVVPALLLGIVGIVEKETWKVVVSTGVLSLFLIVVFWIMNNMRFS